jgi:hypothetical protein
MEGRERNMTLVPGLGRPGPRRRVGDYAPLPLVAAATLLIVLILFTPVLLPTGQPAPGILTQAELIVDRIAGNETTHLYIHGLGTTSRYTEIWVGLASGFNWTGTGGVAWANLNWSAWTNESDVLSLSIVTTANPVAVNVTAYYVSPGGCAWYDGIVAFYASLGGPSGEQLYAATPPSGIGLPFTPVPVDNSSLPLLIPLPLTASGCAP